MSGGGGQAGTRSDKAVLGTAFAVLAGGGCVLLDLWVAAGAASLTATGTWTSLALSPPGLVAPLFGQGPAALAGTAPATFWTVLVVLAVAEVVLGTLAAVRLAEWLHGRHDPSRLARRGDLGDLAGKKAARKARELRPSLRGKGSTELGRDTGIRLMQVAGRDVFMSWEDVALIIMGPRSNKTSAIVVPTILAATGPVVATSNKSDIWSLTRDIRAKVGPTYTFDPMLVSYAAQTWYCDPIEWVRSEPPDRQLEHAGRFISHFMAGVQGERSDPFFTNAAARVATGAVLAAAANPQGTLREVLEYLGDGRREAIQALDTYGDRDAAADLEKTVQGADVTAEGIYETARTGLKALRSEAIMRWVTPPQTWRTPPAAGTECLDPWTLFTANTARPATLYLLSKEGGGGAAPVVTALVDRITDLAERTAQARGGRLDPTLSLVLDESANICPLQNLPAQFSHWGSRGINALAILQSYKQGARVWQREGMDALWSAATVKMVGAGVDDVDFLSWLSQLVGEHWVDQPSSVSLDRRGGGSEQFSKTKESIFPISRLRALPKTDALLINPGKPVAHGNLLPWYAEEVYDVASARDISAANQSASDEIQRAAVHQLGRTNPVARELARERGDDQPKLADPL